MTKTILLTLSKSYIKDAVKSESFLKGVIDKASNANAVAVAYHEQAGDDAYQERILERALNVNLSMLMSWMSDYLVDSGQSSADNISSSQDDDTISISLQVSDRFNGSFVEPLANLCSEFIVNSMLVQWWTPVNGKQAELYKVLIDGCITGIRRCFNKTAPVAPTYKYATTLSVAGSAIDIGIGEEYTVTYSISDGAIDDIEIRIEDGHIVSAGRSREGFTVIGRQLGHTWIQLYSRHDPSVASTVHVYVTNQS